MRRPILTTLILSVLAAGPAAAGTFERGRIAPELGVDALTRGVTREKLQRELFSNPWATVTIGTLDVYDAFPWVESRTFQIVSDPRWNRLVYGESGQGLAAWNGAGESFGALKAPRGLAVDEFQRVFVADAGNDRVLVLEAKTELGELALVGRFVIPGLSDPHDVAVSDGGTPFQAGDDVLYVADTGRNRVIAFALSSDGARQVAEIGELGSGPGRFAGPMAIAVGRSLGAGTPDVYVADAHTRRIVHLRHEGGTLRWIGDTTQDASVLTSLETDQWGNLYAAAPQQGVVRKFSPSLQPVAELRSDLDGPRGFHVPFVTVRDHRDGRVERVGRPNGVSVERWTDRTGVSLWNLGVEVSELALGGSATPEASFLLTDRAAVAVELTDASNGRRLGRKALGTFDAGPHSVALDAADIGGASEVMVRVVAASSYTDGGSNAAQAVWRRGGSSSAAPGRAVLLGNAPNPMTASTRIAFVLPDSRAERVSLRIFDASGRVVRAFDPAFSPGYHEIEWNGVDASGARARAGVYFYRLRVGSLEWTRRLVLVR